MFPSCVEDPAAGRVACGRAMAMRSTRYHGSPSARPHCIPLENGQLALLRPQSDVGHEVVDHERPFVESDHMTLTVPSKPKSPRKVIPALHVNPVPARLGFRRTAQRRGYHGRRSFAFPLGFLRSGPIGAGGQWEGKEEVKVHAGPKWMQGGCLRFGRSGRDVELSRQARVEIRLQAPGLRAEIWSPAEA